MTGTALAAGEQLRQFYKLGVSPIPPNTPEHPRGRGRPRLHHRGRQERRRSSTTSPRCTRPASPSSSAPATSPNPRSCTSGWSRRGVPAVVLNAKNDAEEAARHRRGRQARLGHGVHPDGRPRHRHPAGRLRRGRPRRGRRARRPARGRHRPAPHRAAGQPAARPRRPPGRPRLVGVLLQLGGRRRGRPPRAEQAADRDRRGRPHHQPQGRRACSTTRSGSPRAGCSTCTPTPGATTS